MKQCIVLYVMCACILIAYRADAENEKKSPARNMPKKVQVDTNFDGKADRTEYYNEKGEVERVEVDTNGDGVPEEKVFYENGKPVKGEKDTNSDGKTDVWIEY